MDSSTKTRKIGRGQLLQNPKTNLYKFVFDSKEPNTCGNCKKELMRGYACRECSNVFCFDCVKDYKGCGCYNQPKYHHIQDHEYIRCQCVGVEE